MNKLLALAALGLSSSASAQTIDHLSRDDVELALAASFYALDHDQTGANVYWRRGGISGYVQVTREEPLQGGYERCRRVLISTPSEDPSFTFCHSEAGFWEPQGLPVAMAGDIEVVLSNGNCQTIRIYWRNRGYGPEHRVCWGTTREIVE